MVTGFDLIGHNRPLQDHWVRRTVGYFLDLAVVLLPLWAVLQAFSIQRIEVFGLLSSLLLFLYSSSMDGLAGRTIGKEIVGLRVQSLMGEMDLWKGMVRSASKFFWYVFPFLDAILGLASDGDPRQRLLDKVANTTVIRSGFTASKLRAYLKSSE